MPSGIWTSTHRCMRSRLGGALPRAPRRAPPGTSNTTQSCSSRASRIIPRPLTRSPQGGRCGGTRLRCSDACATRCSSRRRSATGASPCPRCTSGPTCTSVRSVHRARPVRSVRHPPDVNAAAARGPPRPPPPRLRRSAEARRLVVAREGGSRSTWLVKPLASGGGHRITMAWR